MYRVPDKIHDECLNWARWCWQGAWPHPLPDTQCGSAEGDYRAPPEWDMDLSELTRTSRIRPNERNARRVQEAWEGLTAKPRLVLRAEYPGRDGRRSDAAAALAMTISEYETHLQYAVLRVEEAFAVRA